MSPFPFPTKRKKVLPITSSGYPRVVGGTPGRAEGVTRGLGGDVDVDADILTPYQVKVPEGSDSLAQGISQDAQVFRDMLITRIVVDIPEGMTGWLEIDGIRRHETTDGKGSVGEFTLGNLRERQGVPMRRANANFDNQSSGTLQGRYWLVGGVV